MRMVFLLVALFATAAAQPEAVPQTSPAERSLESLRTVADPLDDALADLAAARERLQAAAGEGEKPELRNAVQQELERIEQLRGHFRDIVGGAEAAGYEETEPEKKSAREQLGELVEPVLDEWREATSSAREMDTLSKQLEVWTGRKGRCEAIIARIDRLTALARDETILSELAATRRIWTDRLADANGEIGVLRVRIEELEGRRKPLWDTISSVTARFFRSRGLNLLLAITAAVAGFYLTTRMYRYLKRVSPMHRKASLTSRISDLLAVAAAVLVAAFAVLLVFYARGDWLLLTLAVFLLIGAAWAGKTALPPYLEQIRMVLNLGPVREGERLILRELPWRVESIGFYTRLTNPSLQGGELRVPIRELMGMVSRTPDPHEPWFPTRPD